MELMTQVCEFNRAADTGRWDRLRYEAVEAVLREDYGLGGQDGVLLTRVRCAHVTSTRRAPRLQALPEPSLAEPLAESEWVAVREDGDGAGGEGSNLLAQPGEEAARFEGDRRAAAEPVAMPCEMAAQVLPPALQGDERLAAAESRTVFCAQWCRYNAEGCAPEDEL